jgi:DNA-binding NarL/FixJ family response regulator
MTIRVAVADDQALIRAGLAGIIGTASDLTVSGQACTGRESVDLARSQQPDVILMDIRMPDMNGIEATRLIAASTAARVLILTTFDLDDYVYSALRSGASGFLLKDTRPPDLLAAVRVIAAGDALLAPGITRRLISRFAAQPEPPPTSVPSSGAPAAGVLDAITSREREVLMLIAKGLSNTEIAARLYITPGTAKTHVAHLLTKLGARDRIQLVILTCRTGLITVR